MVGNALGGMGERKREEKSKVGAIKKQFLFLLFFSFFHFLFIFFFEFFDILKGDEEHPLPVFFVSTNPVKRYV